MLCVHIKLDICVPLSQCFMLVRLKHLSNLVNGTSNAPRHFIQHMSLYHRHSLAVFGYLCPKAYGINTRPYP
jgi:hypothetical protein